MRENNSICRYKKNKIGSSICTCCYEMPYLNSVSYSIWIPGGIVADKDSKLGTSLFVPEITIRGNKSDNARELSEKLDSLGVSHSETASLDAFIYQGTCLAFNLKGVLEHIFRSLYEPTFPTDEIENIREVCLQDLKAIEDNPQRLVINNLIEKYHSKPFNRTGDGTKEGILGTSLDDIKELYNKYYRSNILIILAGNIDAGIYNFISDYFSNMNIGCEYIKPVFNETHKKQYFHIDYNSEQTQIALASEAPNVLSPDYYVARLTSELLSGGMFGRLFLEVREKRGLVYSVYNKYVANQYYGKNVLYAGTTPKNAKETLEVSLETIKTLGDNLTEEELIRAKNNLKSIILIQGESSLSRAANIAVDEWQLGGYREKDFIINKINEITLDDVREYVKKYPYENYTLVSLGKNEITGIN